MTEGVKLITARYIVSKKIMILLVSNGIKAFSAAAVAAAPLSQQPPLLRGKCPPTGVWARRGRVKVTARGVLMAGQGSRQLCDGLLPRRI